MTTSDEELMIAKKDYITSKCESVCTELAPSSSCPQTLFLTLNPHFLDLDIHTAPRVCLCIASVFLLVPKRFLMKKLQKLLKKNLIKIMNFNGFT